MDKQNGSDREAEHDAPARSSVRRLFGAIFVPIPRRGMHAGQRSSLAQQLEVLRAAALRDAIGPQR